MRRSWVGLFVIAIVALLSPRARAEDFKPPGNGVFTEKQFTNYMDVTTEWLAASQAAQKAVEGAKTGASALAVYAKPDQKLKDSLAKHGLSEDEYSWIAGQAWESYSVVMLDDV